jgi:hypothetical protein
VRIVICALCKFFEEASRLAGESDPMVLDDILIESLGIDIHTQEDPMEVSIHHTPLFSFVLCCTFNSRPRSV